MCGDRPLFSDLKTIRGIQITTAHGVVEARNLGNLKLEVDNGSKWALNDCFHWEGVPNLLSVRQLSSKGYHTNLTLLNDSFGKEKDLRGCQRLILES